MPNLPVRAKSPEHPLLDPNELTRRASKQRFTAGEIALNVVVDVTGLWLVSLLLPPWVAFVGIGLIPVSVYFLIRAAEEAWARYHTVPLAMYAEQLAAARLARERFEQSTPELEVIAFGGSDERVIKWRVTLHNPPGGSTISLRAESWTAKVQLRDGSEQAAHRVGAIQRPDGHPGVDALRPGEAVELMLSAVFRDDAPRSSACWKRWTFTVDDRQGRTLRAEYLGSPR